MDYLKQIDVRMLSGDIEMMWEICKTDDLKAPWRVVASGPTVAPMSFPFKSETDALCALWRLAEEYDRQGYRMALG
jgi:hypothetical protein